MINTINMKTFSSNKGVKLFTGRLLEWLEHRGGELGLHGWRSGEHHVVDIGTRTTKFNYFCIVR